MAKNDFTGPDKAAILLIFLGEDVASEVLKHFDTEEIKEVGTLMSKFNNVPSHVVDSVVEELYEESKKGAGAIKGSEEYLKSVLLKAMDPSRASEIIAEINSNTPGGVSGIDTLKWLDPDTIANYLKNEHPQTIAVILSQLQVEQAAEILRVFPEQLKGYVTVRLASLAKVPAGVLREIDTVLRTELRDSTAKEASSSFNGTQRVADILNQLDKNTESTLMNQIEENSPELADEIRQLMFKFEDLMNLDNRAIQEILKEVSNDDLCLALRTASNEIKDLILRNMSERAASMLMEDLEAMGPVKLSEVERAQGEVAKTAKTLENEGRIFISGGDDELV